MKTIYFLVYDTCIVHGGFFDNFEYYYLVKKVFTDCKVKYRIITDHPKQDVVDILRDKYDDIGADVLYDIEVIPHKMKKRIYRDPLVIDLLICATNSAIYWFIEHGNFQAARAYIGLADWREIHPRQNKIYKNHLIMCDERIFNYGDSCNWQPYRKKILFDKFKRKSYGAEYDFLLNLSILERRFSQWYMDEIFDTYNGTFAAYMGHKNKMYYKTIINRNNVSLIVPPVENFMGLFETYIYLPYADGWDATPRLIPECVFYDKKVEYHDKNVKSGGGYHRYWDTVNNFYGLELNENDEIISAIERMLQ